MMLKNVLALRLFYYNGENTLNDKYCTFYLLTNREYLEVIENIRN